MQFFNRLTRFGSLIANVFDNPFATSFLSFGREHTSG